jgi:hypothetical protein
MEQSSGCSGLIWGCFTAHRTSIALCRCKRCDVNRYEQPYELARACWLTQADMKNSQLLTTSGSEQSLCKRARALHNAFLLRCDGLQLWASRVASQNTDRILPVHSSKHPRLLCASWFSLCDQRIAVRN